MLCIRYWWTATGTGELVVNAKYFHLFGIADLLEEEVIKVCQLLGKVSVGGAPEWRNRKLFAL